MITHRMTKKVKALLFNNQLKNKAIKTRERASAIITSTTKTVSDADAGLLNKNKSMVDRINKIRNKTTNNFKITEEDIPEK